MAPVRFSNVILTTARLPLCCRRFQEERAGRGTTTTAGQKRSDESSSAAVRQRTERVHADGTRRAGHGLRRGETHARSSLLRVPSQVPGPETEGPHHVFTRLEVQCKYDVI